MNEQRYSISKEQERVKYLNVVSAIPGVFAECTAMHYRVYKIINLMKGGSRKKGSRKNTVSSPSSTTLY